MTSSESRPRLGSELQAELRARLHEAIPGGAHTYAKGDDQFPAEAPSVLVRGSGARVWDADGNEFIEYGMGLRAVTLGHAFPRVVEAASRALLDGANFLRPSLLELECAEKFLGVVSGADMVKFTKDGSTANTAAVKLARAHTGRELVAFCGEHPFFSYDDWFIGTTAFDGGIPPVAVSLSRTFQYNDLESLERVFAEEAGRVACVMLEPERTEPPDDGFLEGVAELCRKEGAVLVFDEMVTGFRWHNGGAQAVYGVTPDLSTFGKALGNGFAISALAGRRELMELGGLRTDRERVFLLSTTHGAENHALAAAITTMDVYLEEDVVGRLHEAGRRLREGVEAAAAAAGVSDYVRVLGRDCCLLFATRDSEGQPSQEYRTLFMQELVRGGVLAPSFVVSYSHDDDTIDATIDVVTGALEVYRRALDDGVGAYLAGPSVKPVYRRFN
jgi:glutamate-1-semialdehyde 2,1-aminomutase